MSENVIVILSAFAVVVAILAIFNEARNASRTVQAQLMLTLEEHSRQHQRVHLQLRPGGKWHGGEETPTTAEDWADIEDYMGFFEHMKILLDLKMLDKEFVSRIFRYRIDNIVQNETICVEKLQREADYWKDFIDLCRLLEIVIPCISEK